MFLNIRHWCFLFVVCFITGHISRKIGTYNKCRDIPIKPLDYVIGLILLILCFHPQGFPEIGYMIMTVGAFLTRAIAFLARPALLDEFLQHLWIRTVFFIVVVIIEVIFRIAEKFNLYIFGSRANITTCVLKNDLEMVKRLLEDSNLDVNAKSQDGSTLLHDAAFYGHLDICKLLIEHGAYLDVKNDDGHTPLHFAVWFDTKVTDQERPIYLDTCKLLLKHGADINAKNAWENTPLHDAASEFGYLEMCEMLIEHGADVNAKGELENTPLHYAAKFGHLDICWFLIKHDADIHALDQGGKTPLDIAVEYKHDDICNLLRNWF